MKIGDIIARTTCFGVEVGTLSGIETMPSGLTLIDVQSESYHYLSSIADSWTVMPILEEPRHEEVPTQYQVDSLLYWTTGFEIPRYPTWQVVGQGVVKMSGLLDCPSILQATEPPFHECSMKQYIGLTESYQYCTVCDKKA